MKEQKNKSEKNPDQRDKIEGILPKPEQPVTLEAMDEAIRECAAKNK